VVLEFRVQGWGGDFAIGPGFEELEFRVQGLDAQG
jgi:hypothetical protein